VDTQSNDLTLAFVVVVLGAIGTYLLLPHRFGTAKPRRVQAVGGGLTALAVLLFALFWKPPGPLLSGLFFYVFSFTALAGALLTITARNPIYSALWFAAVVLSTSGLFLLAGAQFLAVGTVIVYAGAIIVTFLFVIMLAQMEGRALYDRSARSPFRATLTCFLLFWALLYSLFTVRPAPSNGSTASNRGTEHRLVRTSDLALANPSVRAVLERASRSTSHLRDDQGLMKPHVAGLGETLFTDNLVAVELAGGLLFVALIGALSIAPPKRPIRPGERPTIATPNL
jgi:NADH-quinone oxidoreductase subunit J